MQGEPRQPQGDSLKAARLSDSFAFYDSTGALGVCLIFMLNARLTFHSRIVLMPWRGVFGWSQRLLMSVLAVRVRCIVGSVAATERRRPVRAGALAFTGCFADGFTRSSNSIT